MYIIKYLFFIILLKFHIKLAFNIMFCTIKHLLTNYFMLNAMEL